MKVFNKRKKKKAEAEVSVTELLNEASSDIDLAGSGQIAPGSDRSDDMDLFLRNETEDPEPSKKKGPDPQAGETFTCSQCGHQKLIKEMRKLLYVCPVCGKHHKISARRRMRNLVDPGSFRKLKCNVGSVNPLDYPEYEDKIAALQEKTGMDEGVLAGVGEIEGQRAVIAVMGSEFLMGSMGIAVGEKITKAFEVAEKLKLPVIIFTASGGARMQEGILSLMQMAKTSAAAKRFSESGGLYIAVLTYPTTGGVSASFATLADITLA